MSNNLYLFGKKMLISERVTSIEAFGVCPKKYNEIPFDGSNVDTIVNMTVGDVVHLAHQYSGVASILTDKFFDETLPLLCGKRDNLKKAQTHRMIDLAQERADEFKDYEKYFEVKNSMVISGVLVTGSYDCLVVDKDGTYRLFDYKTAGNISYYESWAEKFQVMIYAYFIMKQFKVEKIRVSYQIYVKGKDNEKATSVRKTKMMYLNKSGLLNQSEYIDDIGVKVEKLVNEFREAKESGFFVPKDHNNEGGATSACRYCPMRNQETADEYGLEVCDLKKDCSSIDGEGEISFNF